MLTPVLAYNPALMCALSLLTAALNWHHLTSLTGSITRFTGRVSWLLFIALALFVFQLPTTLLAESVLICSSVALIRLDLQGVFQKGESNPFCLALCGVFNAVLVVLGELAGNVSFSIAFLLAVFVYGCLHCFLHEREAYLCRRQEARTNALVEEKPSINQPCVSLSAKEVMKRWLPRWGLTWLGSFLFSLGAWEAFMVLTPNLWQHGIAAILSVLPPHPAKDALEFGYFSDFHHHFARILRTLFQAESLLSAWDKASLILQILLLFLIAGLPVLGIFRSISALPGRLRYRVLRFAEEERLLYLIVSVAMILSTFGGQGTVSNILGYGVIAIMLGYIALTEWLFQNRKSVATLFADRKKGFTGSG